MESARLWMLFVATLALGCGADDDSSASDAARDTDQDVMQDVDAAHDAIADGSPDQGMDDVADDDVIDTGGADATEDATDTADLDARDDNVPSDVDGDTVHGDADADDLDAEADTAEDVRGDPSVDALTDADAAPTDATDPDTTNDGSSDTVDDTGPDTVELLRRDGCSFTVESAGMTQDLPLGEIGVRYRTITVRFDTVHGGWREDLFDREVLNHILFGLSRNAPVSRERYILGLAAQIDPQVSGLRRRSIFFGRVDLEESEPGMGYTAYTSFRDDFAWRPDATYSVEAVLDVEARRQILRLLDGETEVLRTVGAIDYMSPDLTDDGWVLQLGGPETEHRDVSPVGWTICDLRVTAEPLP